MTSEGTRQSEFVKENIAEICRIFKTIIDEALNFENSGCHRQLMYPQNVLC